MEFEIRTMRWRFDTDKHYGFVLAKTAEEAAEKAKEEAFCEVLKISGPFERQTD
jgi:hypothetical protein